MKYFKQTTLQAIALIMASYAVVHAQDVTTVEATSDDISQNLDLEAVASLFGDSKNLEDFEYKLNDPKRQISNLDLNEDGNVDYLRVVETAQENTHLIALQAVLDQDIYQDVATIEVEKDQQGQTRVQVVGDTFIYGPAYIVEPVYVRRPLIYSIFWVSHYRPYRSIYYWGHYPRHFHYWRPFHTHRYHKHVHVHVNTRHTYKRVRVRHSHTAVKLHSNIRRNDFARNNPDRAYAVRVAGVNKSNGSKKRTVAVKQADGDTYRATAVNKQNGTKKRAVGVNKADGTKKRAVGINQADGDKYRATGVNKADGTKKRAAGVNKSDGTKKRVASVSKPDGSRKTVAVKTNPNGSKRAVAVKKDANGSRTVKTATKKSSGTTKKSRSTKKKKR